MLDSVNTRVNNSVGAAAFLSACILFYLIPPYLFWTGFLATNYSKVFLSLLLAILFFINSKKLTLSNTLLFLMLLSAIVLNTFTSEGNINYFIGLLPCVFLPFANDEFTNNVYQWFLKIYVVLITISFIVWVFAVSGFMPSLGIVPPLNSFKSYNYIVYPLLVIPTDTSLLFRFFGLFDEPGVVGTISGILLCIEKINLKNWKSIVLLVTGLCSLSFFFYILIPVYFIIFNALSKRSIKQTVLILLLIASVFFIISRVPILHEAVGIRFEWDSEKGKFVGDNRANNEIIESYFDHVKSTGQIWWGIRDKESFKDDTFNSSSFFTIVIINGLVFTILYLLFFVFYGYHYKINKWSFILYLFVVFGTLYQRPFIFVSYYVFLFTYLAKKEKIGI